METKYFSDRVKSTSFGAEKSSPGESYPNLRLLKKGRKIGGMQKMLVASSPSWRGHTILCGSLAVVPVPIYNVSYENKKYILYGNMGIPCQSVHVFL